MLECVDALKYNLNIDKQHSLVFGWRRIHDALLLPEQCHLPVVLLEIGVLHQDVVTLKYVSSTPFSTRGPTAVA